MRPQPGPAPARVPGPGLGPVLLVVVEVWDRDPGIVLLGRSLERAELAAVPLGALDQQDMGERRPRRLQPLDHVDQHGGVEGGLGRRIRIRRAPGVDHMGRVGGTGRQGGPAGIAVRQVDRQVNEPGYRRVGRPPRQADDLPALFEQPSGDRPADDAGHPAITAVRTVPDSRSPIASSSPRPESRGAESEGGALGRARAPPPDRPPPPRCGQPAYADVSAPGSGSGTAWSGRTSDW